MKNLLFAESTELLKKVAIITGASRGIGAAAARELASHGVSVVLAARSLTDIEKIAAEIEASGGKAIAVACDVSNYEDVTEMVAKTISAYGRLDILINNAGLIDPISLLADSDPEEWVKVADVNYKGVYFGLRAAIPEMLSHGGGAIVNISSGAATRVLEGWSHYCSSKAAALSLTKSVHEEYAQQGIQICGLSPGTVATDMQVSIKQSGINPVSQLDPAVHIPPEWVARAIAWLCTSAAEDFRGEDFMLRDESNRRRLGLLE